LENCEKGFIGHFKNPDLTQIYQISPGIIGLSIETRDVNNIVFGIVKESNPN